MITWSVKNLYWHFWQLSGGRLCIIFGWIFTLWIHCIWFRSCSMSFIYPSHTSQITNPLPWLFPGWPGFIDCICPWPLPLEEFCPLPPGNGVIEILGEWDDLFVLLEPMLWNIRINFNFCRLSNNQGGAKNTENIRSTEADQNVPGLWQMNYCLN